MSLPIPAKLIDNKPTNVKVQLPATYLADAFVDWMAERAAEFTQWVHDCDGIHLELSPGEHTSPTGERMLFFRSPTVTDQLIKLAPNGVPEDRMKEIEVALDAMEDFDVDDFITDLWRAKDVESLREACSWAHNDMIQVVINVLRSLPRLDIECHHADAPAGASLCPDCGAIIV